MKKGHYNPALTPMLGAACMQGEENNGPGNHPCYNGPNTEGFFPFLLRYHWCFFHPCYSLLDGCVTWEPASRALHSPGQDSS